MLDPGRGRTKTGQLWAYAREIRPWGGTDPPGVAYVYAPDRKAERPIAHLAGFNGILQVDGYAGYPCWPSAARCSSPSAGAHVRRRFYELAPRAPRRSPARRSKRIAASTRSRTRSAAAAPRSAAPCASRGAGRLADGLRSPGCAPSSR